MLSHLSTHKHLNGHQLRVLGWAGEEWLYLSLVAGIVRQHEPGSSRSAQHFQQFKCTSQTRSPVLVSSAISLDSIFAVDLKIESEDGFKCEHRLISEATGGTPNRPTQFIGACHLNRFPQCTPVVHPLLQPDAHQCFTIYALKPRRSTIIVVYLVEFLSIPLPSIQEVDKSFICVKTNQDEPSMQDSP
ncbi:hypothetical protein PSTT_16733 [Puccinia striiformis]|uniref:Uncharacterized protein n=1 Tax=Puccinia striiformis TaxID=27350 RepID=A0A2S4UBI0_9BASI|nr:hypothetical protein PSTT_16733 [Puccinia striiformis]